MLSSRNKFNTFRTYFSSEMVFLFGLYGGEYTALSIGDDVAGFLQSLMEPTQL